jgi:hypothetical protein
MSPRDRMILAIVCVIAAAAGSWFFLIGPKRDQVASLDKNLSTVQGQLQSVRTEIAVGQQARSSFARSYTMMAKLGEAVPPDDDVPSLVWQLQSAAHKSNIDFRSLTLNGASSSSSGGAAASTGTSSGASLPPGATIGSASLPIEPFTFTFQGNFFHLADYFGRIQRFVVATNKRISIKGRLLTLNAISLGPAPQGFPRITATVSATTYILPASQGVFDGATQAGPAATPGQSVSTPGSSSSSPAAAAAVATSPLPR